MEFKASGDLIEFSGMINEKSDFSFLKSLMEESQKASSNGRVRISFANVEKANSVGILNYFRAIKECPAKITYVGAPEWLVEQFNMLAEFFENGAQVESVLLPFYCPVLDSISFELLTFGKELPLQEDYSEFVLQMKNSDNQVLEPDFEVESTLAFVGHFLIT